MDQAFVTKAPTKKKKLSKSGGTGIYSKVVKQGSTIKEGGVDLLMNINSKSNNGKQSKSNSVKSGSNNTDYIYNAHSGIYTSNTPKSTSSDVFNFDKRSIKNPQNPQNTPYAQNINPHTNHHPHTHAHAHSITLNLPNNNYNHPPPHQKVYCICRSSDESRNMIECESCNDWFHFDCIHLNPVLTLLFFMLLEYYH